MGEPPQVPTGGSHPSQAIHSWSFGLMILECSMILELLLHFTRSASPSPETLYVHSGCEDTRLFSVLLAADLLVDSPFGF